MWRVEDPFFSIGDFLILWETEVDEVREDDIALRIVWTQTLSISSQDRNLERLESAESPQTPQNTAAT